MNLLLRCRFYVLLMLLSVVLPSLSQKTDGGVVDTTGNR